MTEADRTIIINMSCKLELTRAWHELDACEADQIHIRAGSANGLWHATPRRIMGEHRADLHALATNVLVEVAGKRAGYTREHTRDAKRFVAGLTSAYYKSIEA